MEEFVQYGETFSEPYNGPKEILLFDNQYLVIIGGIFDTEFHATLAIGAILVVDKSTLSSIKESSARFIYKGE